MAKRPPEPDYAGVELELYQAFLRLVAGEPTNPDLRRKLKKDQLRINATTVAKEAGRARTLIGFTECAYPRIRAKILALKKSSSEPPTTFEQLNENLRKENRMLREAVNLSTSRVAAMLRRMNELEKKANAKIKTAQRIIDGASGSVGEEKVAGTRLIEESSTVVPIKPN